MIHSLKRLGPAFLGAAIVATPLAAHSCDCGKHGPSIPVYVPAGVPVSGYDHAPVARYYSYVQPSADTASSIQRRPRPSASQYYTPDEARVLYRPVVVPLDEFLRPSEPVALTPEQFARQKANAEARATPPQLVPGAGAPAATPEADPFADDAASPRETSEPATSTAPAEEDTFAEDDMTAEEPEAEAPPEAEASPEAEPAEPEADPFDS